MNLENPSIIVYNWNTRYPIICSETFSKKKKKNVITNILTMYMIIFLSYVNYTTLSINLGTLPGGKDSKWLKAFGKRIPNELQSKLLELSSQVLQF